MSQKLRRTIASPLVGAAGVHFVVSELSFRGLIALPTMRNTAGVDVLVSSQDGGWSAHLQVKTSQNKVGFWPLGTKYVGWHGPNLYYAFVRFLRRENRFEAFLESSNVVAEQATRLVHDDRQRGLKDWAPYWKLPTNPDELERVRSQWRDFGPPSATPG